MTRVVLFVEVPKFTGAQTAASELKLLILCILSLDLQCYEISLLHYDLHYESSGDPVDVHI